MSGVNYVTVCPHIKKLQFSRIVRAVRTNMNSRNEVLSVRNTNTVAVIFFIFCAQSKHYENTIFVPNKATVGTSQ